MASVLLMVAEWWKGVQNLDVVTDMYLFFFCILSFGYFPGVRMSFADVSEPSVRSIFKG
jgi:hypothetical protein